MANWLDKYEQGGLVLKKKTKDNYGKRENANEGHSTAGPGWVGEGTTNRGFNYNGAWGGTMQNGGFLQPTSSKLPEGYVIPYNTPSTELAMSIGGEKGEPAYLIPSFKGGKKLKDPIAEYKKTGEHLGGPFKTWQEAEKFGEMRHEYVEKGQNIPSPLKWWDDMQMGGSMPGAVGFTYARTAGSAPANGKYTKKTLASAQNGIELKTSDPAFKNIDPSILKNITTSDINEVKNNLLNYISSDLYKQRQKNIPEEPYSFPASSYENKDDYEKNFKDHISNLKQSGRLLNLYDTNTKLSNLGLFEDSYKSKEKTAYINKKGTNAVIAHELTHSIFGKDNSFLDSDFDNSQHYEGKRSIPSMFLNKGEQAYLNDLIKFKDSNLKNDVHYDPSMRGNSANESYSDLMGFRQLLKDNGITKQFGDNITDKDFQRALKIKKIANDPNFKRMRLKYKDEHIPVLNNIIAKNEDNNIVPQAQNGKEMSFYQNGLDFKPKTISKNGSVIKDDRGQWAHPGEVTEIGSNNITMQGVNYPVLGVSDTGDTQMMQPNQDYKFDGDKVVEYPMMQEGGWLDKYPEPMRQDATRVAPPVLKLTDKEKLENAAKSDQAQKRALKTAKEELAERQKNKATKGDINTSGSWHLEDKARLFPSSVGGAGEMFDEYINPATYVGILGDALGESVAARDPKGIAKSLALSAVGGALGFDPLGGAIKTAKSIAKRVVKPSFTSGQEAYDFINNMVSNGQEDQMLKILTEKTGKTSSQLENEFGRAIGNDGTIRDPEYIIRHANMISGKNNLPKLPKSLKELDETAGKLVSPPSYSKFDNSKIVARANEILKKGVGIKNKDIPIELKSRTDNELELWVNDNNPQYVTGQSKSGTIDLNPNFRGADKSLTFTDWLKGKKPTTKYDTYDPDAIPAVIKTGDFPYQSRLDLEGTGIGAETAEALKQALNEEGLQLHSSKSHTEAGKLRYLTEFLNNRKQVVDYSDNPDWMIQAEALRDLLGGAPISKKEAKAYMNEYPVLKPAHVRFQYDNGGWLNKYK